MNDSVRGEPAGSDLRSATVGLDHPMLATRTGEGIMVGVVDSGVHPGHPHIGSVDGGVAVQPDGSAGPDCVDRLGHGTAVTAAIQDLAPGASAYVVKVFDRQLATASVALVRAIDAAASHGVHLINMSLGTDKPESERVLSDAVRRAAEHGVVVVAAGSHEGRRWFPGCFLETVAVTVDWSLPRDRFRIGYDPRDGLTIAASGYPRPIPGVPPDRNLKGISFAVANATALCSRIIEGRTTPASPEELGDLLFGLG